MRQTIYLILVFILVCFQACRSGGGGSGSGPSSGSICKGGTFQLQDGAKADFFGGDNVDVDIYEADGEASLIVGVRSSTYGNLGSNVGIAYIYSYNPTTESWESTTTLTAPDAKRGDAFGTSVAIYGDWVAVGAPLRDCGDAGKDCGSVYMFQKSESGWNYSFKLKATDQRAEAMFGIDLALGEDKIVVGAHRDSENGKSSGAVYAFNRVGSQLVAHKLTPSDAAKYDTFGFSLALYGNRLLVGAGWDDYNDNDATLNTGAVYFFLYENGEWDEVDKLTAYDRGKKDTFGASLDMSSKYASIGAPLDDDIGADSGSVYIYQYDSDNTTWNIVGKVIPEDGAPSDNFGKSVAISNDVLAVSSKRDTEGYAYIYTFDTNNKSLELRNKLIAPIDEAAEFFGSPLAISTTNVLFVGGISASSSCFVYCDWSEPVNIRF